MSNYDKMAEQAAHLFLQQDQEALLKRHPLRADERYLYLTFLSDSYRIDRATGEVLGTHASQGTPETAPCVPCASDTADGSPTAHDAAASDSTADDTRNPLLATPRQALIVMDMACNPIGAPIAAGSWITMAEASGASSSVSTSSLFDKLIETFSGQTARLQAACDAIGARNVAGGEVSCLIDIFDNYPIWLQFWDGDDEFPAQMKFLWDSSVRLYLHYETMWYILYEILERLIAQ